ncbi:MAG TPA: hypothetical protein VFG91_12455 [Woeseiaceae bacterium]|nr:hypothetical protein [Woeseiaceae bacterium]
MKRRTPSFARALLLLIVAVGPLQAQTVFACAMMGKGMMEGCCCEHHASSRECETPDCGAVPESDETPCCEHRVEITVDPDADDGTVSKPVEPRSDIDPPSFVATSFEARLTSPAIPDTPGFHYPAAAGHGGSATWLVTQRLRI